MRVLLDESVPLKLRHHFQPGITPETVQYRGWRGLRNGELLRAAERDFDVLVTLDRHIPEQQSLARFEIAVVILQPRFQQLAGCLELLPELEQQLPRLRPGEVIRIHPPAP